MNRPPIQNELTEENRPGKKTVRLTGDGFVGRALEPHTIVEKTSSGASIVRRGTLGEMLYRYRYLGEGGLLGSIAARFIHEIESLFREGALFDLIVMVPPPVGRPDYVPVVELVTGLSKKSGIPSAQFAVRSVFPGNADGRSVPGRPGRKFVFSSPETVGVFSGKRILVIDDICRSGRSLHAFCDFLEKEGRAKSFDVLVGTIVEK